MLLWPTVAIKSAEWYQGVDEAAGCDCFMERRLRGWAERDWLRSKAEHAKSGDNGRDRGGQPH